MTTQAICANCEYYQHDDDYHETGYCESTLHAHVFADGMLVGAFDCCDNFEVRHNLEPRGDS